jgi:RecA-family ATPase
MADLAGELFTLPRREADSNYLAVFDKDDNMELTEFFHQLLEDLKAFGARLVVLDTREDVFCGDQNNPIHARTFVRGCCDRIARELNGIVLLIYHPSVRGTADGDYQSGSVQWNSAFRARLVLTRPTGEGKEDDDTVDTRILSLIKGNFAPPTEALKINWKDGAFVCKPAAVDDALTYRAETDKGRRVFQQLRDRYQDQGRTVSAGKGPNYAPRLFADDPDCERCTEKQLTIAMLSLLKDGTLKVGKLPGDRSPHLIKVSAKTA